MYPRELYHKNGHKYIAKVKTSDGRFRYFYDQAEYDAYMKVKKQEDAKKEEQDSTRSSFSTEVSRIRKKDW